MATTNRSVCLQEGGNHGAQGMGFETNILVPGTSLPGFCSYAQGNWLSFSEVLHSVHILASKRNRSDLTQNMAETLFGVQLEMRIQVLRAGASQK